MNKTTFTKQQPGFAAVIAPVIIGLLGMLGAAGVARLDHQAVIHRDVVRLQQIQELEVALKEYKKQTGAYPIQKDEQVDGREVLTKALVKDAKILKIIPQDPKSQDNWDYRYWSEGSVYSFRYLLENNPRQEQLVYGQ